MKPQTRWGVEPGSTLSEIPNSVCPRHLGCNSGLFQYAFVIPVHSSEGHQHLLDAAQTEGLLEHVNCQLHASFSSHPLCAVIHGHDRHHWREVPAYLELLRRAAAKGVHPQVRGIRPQSVGGSHRLSMVYLTEHS
jgi:hypothetical protein